MGLVGVQTVDGAQTGDQRVEDALGDLVALGVEDGGGGHEVTDVADEQQGPAVQFEFAAVESGVDPVVVERAGQGLAALVERLGQVAAVQAEPVAVSDGLVVGVDCGDGVLEVHDRGDGGFEDDVLDSGGVGASDGGGGVDLDLDVQAVVAQQHRGGGVLVAR